MKVPFLRYLTVPLALAAIGQPASAVDEADFALQTTRDLYDVCSIKKGEEHYVAAIYACRGFMEGAVQYHDAVSIRKSMKRLICYPPSATLEDARSVFLAWAEANGGNSGLLGEAPVVGLVRALSAEYPCSG